MSDTILTMSNGSKWRPSSSVDTIQCHNCDNLVDTPEEVATYPDGSVQIAESLGRQKLNGTRLLP